VAALSRYYLGPAREQGLLLGYSGFGVPGLLDGVRRLAAAFAEAFPVSGF